MARTKGSSPLKFLDISDWMDLENLLDEPAQLQTQLACYILDRLFQFGCQPTVSGLNDLSQRLAGDLLEVIGKKLKQDYPHGAAKTIKGVQIEQALSYLIDAWVNDFCRHPKDSPQRRYNRVLPSLNRWPNADMRARPQHGKTSQLTYLVLFEDAMKALKGLPRRPHNGHEEKQRRAFLDQVLHLVPSVPGRPGWRFLHPETEELFFEIPDAAFQGEMTRWVTELTRREIALEITAAVVTRTGVHLTAKTLRRLLPKLRTHKHSINRALGYT